MVAPSFVLHCCVSCIVSTVSTTSAQSPTNSPWDSCSSVQSYVQSHPNCYIDNFEGSGFSDSCSGFFCYTNYNYTDIYVNECEDPVSVAVYYDSYGDYDYDYSNYYHFQYAFNQSETVDNDASYGDSGRYTAIMARNASHLGFEVYTHCLLTYLVHYLWKII